LLYVGLRSARQAADGVAVDGRVAPAEDGQALLTRNFFDDPFADQAVLRVDRKKNHADAIFTRQRQRETQAGRFALEEGVRNLD
jgi:hypothetical protein